MNKSLEPQELLNKARQIIDRDAAAVVGVKDQLGPQFLAVADTLLHCQGKVLITGMGTSGAVARRMAHLFSCVGTSALFIHAADGLHGGLGAVAPEDVVIAISKGGSSDELNEFAARAKERSATVIAITGDAASPLAKSCDYVLEVKSPPESDYGGMLAMGSTLAVCALGDALAATLMEMRHYGWESFLFTHPSGAVGKRRPL